MEDIKICKDDRYGKSFVIAEHAKTNQNHFDVSEIANWFYYNQNLVVTTREVNTFSIRNDKNLKK